jgi:hypothetical protein
MCIRPKRRKRWALSVKTGGRMDMVHFPDEPPYSKLNPPNDEILGWEYFVRKFDRGTLHGIESIPAGRFHPTRTAFIYTELLLGGSAGSLALIYGFLLQTSAIDPNRARICGLAVAMVFWVYGMIQAIRVAFINRQIGKAILAQEPRGNTLSRGNVP